MQNEQLSATNQLGVVRKTLSAVCLEFRPWNSLFLITSCITCYI